PNVQYARYADDLVVLIDSHPRHEWIVKAVEKRLREELAKLRVEINEEKSRMVDLSKGESFSFLGFEYRRVRSRTGKWRPHYVPKLKKRTALLRKLKDIFQRNVSQPVHRVIELINPILQGWVRYFAVGHSSRCFSYVKRWVEKKIRRHLMRARGRRGFGWKRARSSMAPVLDPTHRLCVSQRAKPAGSSVRERTSSPSTSKPWKVETFVTLEEAARPHFSRFRQHRRASDAQPLAQGSSPNKSRMVGVFSTMRWKRNHVLIGIRRASTQEMFPRSSTTTPQPPLCKRRSVVFRACSSLSHGFAKGHGVMPALAGAVF